MCAKPRKEKEKRKRKEKKKAIHKAEKSTCMGVGERSHCSFALLISEWGEEGAGRGEGGVHMCLHLAIALRTIKSTKQAVKDRSYGAHGA